MLTGSSRSSSFASTSKLPVALAADGNGTTFVATVGDVQVHAAGAKAASSSVDYTPRSIAHCAARNELAVGGEVRSSVSVCFATSLMRAQDGRVRIYTLGANASLSLAHTTDANRGGATTVLAYSPDGALLAVADAAGKIAVLDAATREVKIAKWVFHTARITCLAWSEDGKHAASGSLDTNVYVWSVDKPMRNIAIKVR
jgi:WD40 repeat protein